jgi:hypothetical protein
METIKTDGIVAIGYVYPEERSLRDPCGRRGLYRALTSPVKIENDQRPAVISVAERVAESQGAR